MTLKSVTNSPIERAILKQKRERKEILSIVLHIVSSFSARKRERKRGNLNHYGAVAIDAIPADFHAASTGAKGAASFDVFDAASDVHAISTVFHAASTGA